MDDGVRWNQLVPPWLRHLPADLVATIGFTVLTICVIFLPVIRETVLRTVVGLLFVLFGPGYVIVAVLFPAGSTERTARANNDERVNDGTRITDLERAALSFGVSIAVVPLVGIVLNFTPFGIRPVPIVLSLAALVLGLTAVTARRRKSLPPEDRFVLPWRAWLRWARARLLYTDSRLDAVLNILLVLSIVVATASVGFAVVAPQRGETFTEFYLLTERNDGQLVADNYPSDFVAGEPRSLVVGVENEELRPVRYTVLVEIHSLETENNTTSVVQAERLRTFETRLEHNETWRRNHTVTPEIVGDNIRLTYMLYRGDPPATPTPDNAYRELHLWINVTDAG